MEGVYCAVRTDSLYKADYVSYLKGSKTTVCPAYRTHTAKENKKHPRKKTEQVHSALEEIRNLRKVGLTGNLRSIISLTMSCNKYMLK
jgi:hypothetical protein